MGWGFRRSKKLAPGLRWNVSKRSLGLSAGRRGGRASVNTRGQKGLSFSWKGLFWRKRL